MVCDRRTPIPLSLCVGYGGFKLSLVKGGGGCFHLSYRAGKGGRGVEISHLLFTDDTLLFYDPCPDQLTYMV